MVSRFVSLASFLQTLSKYQAAKNGRHREEMLKKLGESK